MCDVEYRMVMCFRVYMIWCGMEKVKVGQYELTFNNQYNLTK